MSNKLTDTELVQEIRHVLESEQFTADAVRRMRQILTLNPAVPTEGLPPYDYEAASESERWAYDQGREYGHQEGYDQAITDAIEHPEAFTARLLEIRPGADPQAGRWTDTGSGPGVEG